MSAATAATVHTGSATRPPADVRRWLAQERSADELSAAFPVVWAQVEHEIGELVATKDGAAVEAYIAGLARRDRVHSVGGRRGEQAALNDLVRRRVAVALLAQLRLQASTGVTQGRVRFRLLDGWLAQRLLFEHDLVRKPVPMRRFRVFWRVIRQKRLLMPLVERKGIYCFYSAELIDALAVLVDGRSCLEIAAGDGTLTRFLTDVGVDITATDDYSWSAAIDFPSAVQRLDARAALRRHRPEVVICSWPPAANTFEREVFRSESVTTYIVILSRSEANAGNWADYRRQHGFTFAEVPELSRLVLPPELDPVVLVFRRD